MIVVDKVKYRDEIMIRLSKLSDSFTDDYRDYAFNILDIIKNIFETSVKIDSAQRLRGRINSILCDMSDKERMHGSKIRPECDMNKVAIIRRFLTEVHIVNFEFFPER